MKVLHFAETIKGGIASYWDEVIQYQVQRYGADNVLFLLPRAHVTSLERFSSRNYRVFEGRPRSVSGVLRYFQDLKSVVDDFKPDVVHLHSSFAGFVGRLLLCFDRQVKVIYCAHGWAFGMETSPAKKGLFSFVERLLAMGSYRLICISNYEYRLALRFGLPEKRLALIPNGISDLETPPPGIEHTGIHLVFVGRLDRQKGADILMAAMQLLKRTDLKLTVVGDVVLDGGFAGGSTSNVVFAGWLERAGLQRLFAESDAVIMPSRWEGFGLVAVEAMRQSLAVLASDRGALPEIVEDGKTGMIFELSSESLAKLLEGLDKESLTRMGLEGRRRFERHFVADRMNEAICRIYEQQE